jgi:hypothetical protein
VHEAKPAVKVQSACVAPDIDTGPLSVLQVPITENVSTGWGGVSVSVTLNVSVSGVEEDHDKTTESAYIDDEEDVDEINHETLPKKTFHTHSPCRRAQRSPPCQHVRRIGALNAESFCKSVLSCVKLVVSDLHVILKAEEIRMLVMLRMNREFMEYMRTSYPYTPLSEFKTTDTYVFAHRGVEALVDDEDDE